MLVYEEGTHGEDVVGWKGGQTRQSARDVIFGGELRDDGRLWQEGEDGAMR
jgi:hypothetical protein